MEIVEHQTPSARIAEVRSEKLLINNPEEGLQILVDAYYQGFDHVILHEENLTSDFFDLRTRIAGEILQKASTYRIPITIIGDFEKYQSKSLRDFIYESNKGKQVNFLASVDEALARLD